MTDIFTWKYIMFYSEKVSILSKSCLRVCAIHTFVLAISCLSKPTPHPSPLCFVSQDINLHKWKNNFHLASHQGLPMEDICRRHRPGRVLGRSVHSSCSYSVKLPQASCVPIPEVINLLSLPSLKLPFSSSSDHLLLCPLQGWWGLLAVTSSEILHHPLLISLNLVYIFVNGPFINSSIITPFRCTSCFLSDTLICKMVVLSWD